MWTYSDGIEGSDGIKPSVLAELVESSGGYATGPERVLLSAILFDGIQTYMSYATADSEEEKKRYLEAYRWVQRKCEDYIFSFDNVCDGLGIDPEYLRLGLTNVVNSEEEWVRSRRNF